MDKSHFLSQVDASWTLFLDRDGVINHKIENDYVKSISEFDFLPGVLEALYLLEPLFYKFIVVTNQQGIAKGVMSEGSLDIVHQYMLYEIGQSGGRIDEIYHCPHFANDCIFCRKPNNGMALMAKSDDHNIDFSKSIMIGDSDSDIDFGIKCGMFTVKVEYPSIDNPHSNADLRVNGLKSFAHLLMSYIK